MYKKFACIAKDGSVYYDFKTVALRQYFSVNILLFSKLVIWIL